MAYRRITRCTDTEKAPFTSWSTFEDDDQKVFRLIGERIPTPLANLPVSVLRKSTECGLAARNHATNLVSTECKVSIRHYRGGVFVLWYKF